MNKSLNESDIKIDILDLNPVVEAVLKVTGIKTIACLAKSTKSSLRESVGLDNSDIAGIEHRLSRYGISLSED